MCSSWGIQGPAAFFLVRMRVTRLAVAAILGVACAAPKPVPGGGAPVVPPLRVPAAALELLDTLADLPADGVDVSSGVAMARALANGPLSDSSLAALDTLLTGLWLEAARGLTGARLRPAAIDSAWAVEPPLTDVTAVLDSARRDGRLAAALTALRPRHEGYARLRAALQREFTSAGWPDTALRRLLVVNLERWRWLPPQLETPYLMVNIPAQELRLVEAGGTQTAYRAILGRSDWRTPLVTSAVTQVVLAPSWRVPAEIMRREILPLVRADTTYLQRNGFLVFRGRSTRAVDPATVDWWGADTLRVRLVQQPGPGNPLGRVKLVFENDFSVGLHDTPAPGLFDAPDRALSHGCVRVEKAMELASRLLDGDPKWDAERLMAAAATWTTRSIALPRRVPVYVTYFTAWVDDDGVLQRRADLYGWDARLAAALGF